MVSLGLLVTVSHCAYFGTVVYFTLAELLTSATLNSMIITVVVTVLFPDS